MKYPLELTEAQGAMIAEALHHWRTTARSISHEEYVAAGALIGTVVRACIRRLPSEAWLPVEDDDMCPQCKAQEEYMQHIWEIL